MSADPTLKERSRTVSGFILLAEVTIVLAGALLAYWIYLDDWPLPDVYQAGLVFSAVLSLVVFLFFQTHRLWWRMSLPEEWWRVGAAWSTIVVLMIVAAGLLKVGADYSRIWTGLWAIISGVALLGFHGCLRLILRWLGRRRLWHRDILIVGGGELAGQVICSLKESLWSGFIPVGVIADECSDVGTEIEGVEVIGKMDQITRLIEEMDAAEVWIVLPLAAKDKIQAIMHELRHHTAAIRFVPDIIDLRLINHSMTNIAGLPILNLTESPLSTSFNRFTKVVEDRVLAFLFLVITSPLMLLIALGIKLDSRGPVLFRQERVSLDRKPFIMLKFRSMPVGAESGGPAWARADDPRPTRFGRFLRKTSLDELPQFINVLRGEMSIVGPRPERPVFVEKFKHEIPSYMKKHMMKAGITGWAQVNGWRGDTDINKRIEYDLYYIEHWSLWFDLKIILLTLVKGVGHPSAH